MTCSLYSHRYKASGKKVSSNQWTFDLLYFQNHNIKSIYVKLQKRCKVRKLTGFRVKDIMLLSNTIHIFWRPTCSYEGDSIVQSVEDFFFQSLNLFSVSVKKHWKDFFTGNTKITLHDQICRSLTFSRSMLPSKNGCSSSQSALAQSLANGVANYLSALPQSLRGPLLPTEMQCFLKVSLVFVSVLKTICYRLSLPLAPHPLNWRQGLFSHQVLRNKCFSWLG